MENESMYSKETGKGMERRDFMKIALAAGAATAVASLAGCGSNSGQATGTTETGLATPDKTIDADVVIVGSGIAGHCAAIEAAQAGAKVVVLEKLPSVGGNSAYADGICYPDSEAAAKQIEAAELTMINYNVNTRMTWDVLSHAVENCHWLEAFAPSPQAVLLTGILPNAGAYTPPAEGGVGGGNMIALLKSVIDGLGVQTFVSTPATGLLTTDGAVTGVQATAEDGTVINVNAKSTIVATAGCAENTEMFTAANNWPANKFKYKGIPGHTGDGIKLAQSAGMGSIKNITPMMIGLGISSCEIGSPLAAAAGMEPTNIWVNQDGVRFAPENGWMCTNAIRMQPDSFSIMDQAQFDRVVATGCIVGMVMYVRAGVPQPGMQAEVDALLAAGDPDVFKADTIEGLAQATGIDPAALAATLEQYNADCVAGVDTEFGKDAAALAPLTTAPFYAFRTTANFLVATGGVRCNPELQVTTEDNVPIPGLYVAGVDPSGFFDQTYPVGVAGGVGQQTALHTGRKAGKAAAAYALA